MPRKDPSFTDADLLRLYCKNLNAAEKTRVRKKFRENILHRKAICQDEEDQDDYCAWTKAFDKIVQICNGIGDWMPEILGTLTAIELGLSALSWAGWIGRMLAFLRLVVLVIIQVVIYVGTIFIMVGDLAPYSSFISRHFCKQDDDDSVLDDGAINGTPPNPDSLPPNPAAKFVDDIQQAGRDFLDWFTVVPPAEDTNFDIGPWP